NPPTPAEPMKPRLRLVLNYFTAKRLLSALQTTLQRHEATFGPVEVLPTKQPDDTGPTDASVPVVYANFCRVSATPEELLLEFGLNPDPFKEGPMTVKMNHLVVMSTSGGKKLSAEMEKALRAYEAEFGPIELDVRKRVKNPPKP